MAGTATNRSRKARSTTIGVKDHLLALGISSNLTNYFRRKYQPGAALIIPEDIFPLFNAARIKFVLMGVHGINGWRDEARATQDIDFLIAKNHHQKAIRVIQQAYPSLLLKETLVVTRFIDPATSKVVIDLMRPQKTVLQSAFRYSIQIEGTHRVPDLEMALVSKFAAMVSPYRDQGKKLHDGGDFVDMVIKNVNDINAKKLKRLAEKVYHGGGAEILTMIDDIKAGRRIQF